MNKLNFNIIIFLTTLFLMGFLNIIKHDNFKITELENRALEAKPELSINNIFNGDYFKKYEDYFSDHFMYRDRFVKISSAIKSYRGIRGSDGAAIMATKGENIAESSMVPSKKHADMEEINRESGTMLTLKDQAVELYSFNDKKGSLYADVINRFQDKLGSSVRIYSLLVPTKVEFLDGKIYKNISTSQRGIIERVNQNFNNGIITVNAYDALKNNKDKYIFFRTDHHWTALGAYYAYTAFMDAFGEVPLPISRYQRGSIDNFLGSSYSATLSKNLQNKPDTIYYYKPMVKYEYTVYYNGPLKMNLIDLSHANKKNKYRIFLSGDRPLGKIVTEVKNNRKILVIKDSYGNAFIPYLVPHYNEIYIADPRQFKNNILKFIKDNRINEVLFLNYVPAANSEDFIKLLDNMMNDKKN